MDQIKYQPFSEELFKNTITSVIDADSFAYAISWTQKDALFPEPVIREVDLLVHDILQGTQARHYVGVLSPDVQTIPGVCYTGIPNFRKAIAVSRPYKGMRKEKPEWYEKWAPIINDYLITNWGFIKAPEGFEADDLVATLCRTIGNLNGNVTCCGNDKDLLQIPGNHFNFVKKTLTHISVDEARYRLWRQILMGDSTDNIEGIPGCGEKRATDILAKALPGHELLLVLNTYLAIYEPQSIDLGIRKFYENYMLVKLRDDIDLELVDTEAIRGYDLDTHKAVFQPVQEEIEEIPDFSGEELNFGKDGEA